MLKNWDRHLATSVFHGFTADRLGASPIFQRPANRRWTKRGNRVSNTAFPCERERPDFAAGSHAFAFPSLSPSVSNVTRIFITLAWFAVVMMAATLVVGLSIDDLHTDHSPEMLRWATVHRLAGVADGAGRGAGAQHRRDVLHRHQPLVQGSLRDVWAGSRRSFAAARRSSAARFPGP